MAVVVNYAINPTTGTATARSFGVSDPVAGYPAGAIALAGNPDGELAYATPFDHPFDTLGRPGHRRAFNLVLDTTQAGSIQAGTTLPGWRIVHLQRLADPLNPWNPPLNDPAILAGTASYTNNPNYPVNPYLTI